VVERVLHSPDPTGGALLTRLRTLVGPRDVLTSPETKAAYESDWTGRWRGACLGVVRARDARQVSAVIAVCAQYGVPIVPQGGNTGLVGGGTPDGSGQQIVLSLRGLDEIGEVDVASGQVTAGAGVSLARLQEAARAAGFDAGLDLGARDTATVGGLAACDAGGLKAFRYGTARRRIIGLQAVTADGTIVQRMSGLLKDNAGYNLPALLIGSEGTLGVITAVRWSLVPRLDARATALLALKSVGDAAAVAGALRARAPSLEMLELMTEAGIRRTLAYLSVSAPVPVSPAWMLVECAARTDPQEELTAALDSAGITDNAIVAVDAVGRERLLRIREAHPEAVNHDGVSHKLDVGVPLEALVEFLERLEAVVEDAAPGARLITYGHLGDGNIHVNVLGPDPADASVDGAILALVADCGGTISAEHGIGRHKPGYLRLIRSDGERRLMAAIKHAFDPTTILNPGAVLG
jgi:FAD/FMN-containing dehydrogenase